MGTGNAGRVRNSGWCGRKRNWGKKKNWGIRKISAGFYIPMRDTEYLIFSGGFWKGGGLVRDGEGIGKEVSLRHYQTPSHFCFPSKTRSPSPTSHLTFLSSSSTLLTPLLSSPLISNWWGAMDFRVLHAKRANIKRQISNPNPPPRPCTTSQRVCYLDPLPKIKRWKEKKTQMIMIIRTLSICTSHQI